MKRFIIIILLIVICAAGCSDNTIAVIGESEGTAETFFYKDLLTVNDLKDIVLSHAEGSGSVRTLTIHYTHDGKEGFDKIDHVKRIDLEGYDDENGSDQTFAVSDYNGDGIFDIIVYRDFWFPDIVMAHAGVPEWPTVYEYDVTKGFVIASSKHKDYFVAYAQSAKEQLDAGKEHMSDVQILALKRLVYAAESVADGSFIPMSQYNSQYYEDVYELTKDIKE